MFEPSRSEDTGHRASVTRQLQWFWLLGVPLSFVALAATRLAGYGNDERAYMGAAAVFGYAVATTIVRVGFPARGRHRWGHHVLNLASAIVPPAGLVLLTALAVARLVAG